MANTARSMIEKARTQLGYREGRNNHTKYPPEVPGLAWAQNQPWCQTWISWLAVKTGNTDVVPLTASCLACTNWFKQRKQFHRSGPRPGDLVMYGPSGGTHVDLVTEVSGTKIKVIGGNTGGTFGGAYYNGNGVYEKWTEAGNPKIHGFARPSYKTAPNDQTTVLPGVGGGQKPPVKGKITVKRGMTLLGICALLGVTLGEMLTANPQVKDADLIREGQELNIPDKKGVTTPKSTAATPRSTPPAEPDKGTPVTESQAPARTQQNPTVKPGVSGTDRATTRYKVQRGDTLSGIAVKHGVSLKALMDLNTDRWPDPNLIHSGQHVHLPGDVRVPDTVNKSVPCSCKTNNSPKPSKPVRPAPVPSTPSTPAPETVSVSLADVMPFKPPVVQRGWDRPLTADERANARVIYDQALVAFGRQDGPRAAVIGIATAYQESRLRNLPGGHLDSAGLFQQRPSQGWGTHAQVTDPVYAATKFFTTLKQAAPDWKSMLLWEASHKVQRSGSPMAPATFELAAAKLVVEFSGGSSGRHAKPYDPAKDQPIAPAPQTPAETVAPSSGWVTPVSTEPATAFGTKGSMWASGQHTGTDFPAPQGTPVVAAGAGKVVETGWAGAYGQSVVIEHDGGVRTRYAHLSAIGVSVGQTVQAGDAIGAVGSTGNSTGPHLHLEFIVNGVAVDPMTYLRG
ncbi:peptidoglycan DD-metalloendopeptidase family protein [Streptomyces sp. NPDC006798]|uniref:peptidoglycan DD-metalloendopeptidase family protein n=1 Tax=Streptomyces sp. NPDC006798 TaxID=3155462 RepID=UPI0033E2FC8B